MNVDTAKAAGQLAAAIELATAKLAFAQTVKAEAWPLDVMQYHAPATGSTSAQGTLFDALTFGPANTQDTSDAIDRVIAYLQAQLDALTAQLAAL